MRTAHYVSFTSRALQISNPHRTADRPIHTVCQSYFCTMHFQLSQWSKPQKLHRPPFKWTAKRLLWYPFQCVEWKVTSVTATQFYGAFIPRNLHSFFLKFDCRSVIIQTHLAVCFLIVIWKNLCVLWATILRDFTEHFTFRQKCQIRKGEKYETSSSVSPHLFRALAASRVFYKITEHSQGFSLC